MKGVDMDMVIKPQKEVRSIPVEDLPKYSPIRVLFERLATGDTPIGVATGNYDLTTTSGVDRFNSDSIHQGEGMVWCREKLSWSEEERAARLAGWRLGEVSIQFERRNFDIQFWWKDGQDWQAGSVRLDGSPWWALQKGREVIEASEGRVLLPLEVAAVLASGVGYGGTWVWEDHEGLPDGLICLRHPPGFNSKASREIQEEILKAEEQVEAALEIGHYHEDNPHGLLPVHLVLAGVALNSSSRRKIEDPSKYKSGVIELPGFVPDLLDQLWGPCNGDVGVKEDRFWDARPGYSFDSPFVLGRPRPARHMVWVGLPKTQLWTAYGSTTGVIAPKEFHDPYLTDSERPESEKFWMQEGHAFCTQDEERVMALREELVRLRKMRGLELSEGNSNFTEVVADFRERSNRILKLERVYSRLH